MKLFNHPIIHLFLLFIAVIGLYWQTTNFDFVLDDTMVITENNFVKKGCEGIKEIFGNDSMTGYLGKQPDLLAGGRYRPLSLVVFALSYDLFGANSIYFHLLNVVCYLFCCIFLYYTLLLLFNKPKTKHNRFYAFGATFLFAIHPVHTEAVANVKGLDEVMALMFAIGALYFMLQYYDKKKIIFIILGASGFLLSLLSKESTLPLIFAMPVALYFFRNASLKKVFYYFLLFLIPMVLYLIIRYNAMGFLLKSNTNTTSLMNNPFFEATAGQKTGTILLTLLLYVKLLFFPHPLTHDYYPFHIKYTEIYHPLAIIALLILGALIWFAIKGIKRRNKLAYPIFFFFVAISIVSNVVVNVGAFMNERFLFLPSVAFSILVVLASEKIACTKFKVPGLIILALMSAGFIFKTTTRIPDWSNEHTLNKSAAEVSKNSARANCFYGVSLYKKIQNDSISKNKAQKIQEACKYIDRALEIYPEYSDALKMKAGLAAEDYKLTKDAETLLETFIEILKLKHVVYIDEFTNWMEKRIDKKIMADYYFKAGYEIFAIKNKNFTFASRYLQKGYKLNPEHQQILFGNCIISFLTNNYKQTINYGSKYLQRYGNDAEILFYIAHAQIKLGSPQVGRKNLAKAHQLNPALKNRKIN